MTGDLERDLEELVARCITAMEIEGAQARERICAERPELAAQIRKRLGDLEEAGLLQRGAELPEDPRQVGPYRILERLGEGGMGAVFLAEQREPVRRRVALKMIKLGMDTREVLLRFEAERQALAILNHPNIARVFDAGSSEQGRPYFVMEYVPGVPITRYCDERELDTEQRLEHFLALCDAVQHAHHKGIIHRDLKPSNVLVMEEGGRALPKIIDFGVAKATSQRLTERTLFTEQGRIIGTPEYMSPEQAGRDILDIDTRTDVYSLGAMLYELLTGSLPFEPSHLREAGFDEMRRIIREEDPPTPSTRVSSAGEGSSLAANARSTDPTALSRSLRGDLDWITLKALEKDRNRRYSTVLELAADIRRHLDDEPVAACPPARLYRLGKLLRRHREAALVALLVLAALIAGLISTTAMYLRADANARIASRNEEIARKRLRELLDLSTIRVLEDLETKADQLWPPEPSTAGAMKAWLERARALRPKLEALRGGLIALRAESPPSERAALGGAGEGMSANERLWRVGLLSKLVASLKRFFEGPAPAEGTLGCYGSTIPEVERRLALAETIAARSVSGERVARRWSEARADIADAAGSYGGLALDPQLGLVPIGEDPHSHLWEFAHLESGEPARRDPQGNLVLGEETGLVFVLIPGGSFAMGSQKVDPQRSNYDADAPVSSSPVQTVNLAPFLLSKYELTQGQWLRLAGYNPSTCNEHVRFGDVQITLRHPVENVSWTKCEAVLKHWNLDFPTEAQWEYACRAGTRTRWWVGSERALLADAANLRDQYRRLHSGQREPDYEPWDDGHAVHAPVGCYRANAFGLHDTHGNVWEWCRDRMVEDAYRTTAPRPGDGLREPAAPSAYRVTRGGCYWDLAELARSARRSGYPSSSSHQSIGVRPIFPMR